MLQTHNPPSIPTSSSPVPEPASDTTQPPSLVLLGLAISAGVLLAWLFVVLFLPGLASSLVSATPKAAWYIARSTAMVAFYLLWMSMALGLTITSKTARMWPGGPQAFDLHQHTSLLGLLFAVVHGVVLLGDQYIGYSLTQILLPFSSSYEPFWVGLGQLAVYGMAIVGASFYVRRWIGQKSWRALHFLSFLVFGLVLVHGIASGTDTSNAIVQGGYWFAGASLLFGTIYRILRAQVAQKP